MAPRSTLYILTAAAILLLISGAAHATTWDFDATSPDPFSDGICRTPQPMSSGSYIYGWPSKYDVVYWPHTTEYWVWYCPASGYVSFGDDFSKLTDAEKKRIKTFLDRQPPQDLKPIGPRRTRMEAIYRLRDMDTEFWAWFFRIQAYTAGDKDKALEYRRKALPLIEEMVKTMKPGPDKIAHLYLAGDYHRQLGDLTKARSYFAQAKTHKWKDKDGSEKTGIPYFDEIIAEREKLIPENN